MSAQPLSEQLPFSQHFESDSQQAVVHTQLDDPHGQAEVFFEFMAYIVPATVNNNAVERMTSFIFILFVNLGIQSCSFGHKLNNNLQIVLKDDARQIKLGHCMKRESHILKTKFLR